MRKVLALIVAALVLSFSGCSSKEASASENAVKEPAADAKISTYLVGTYADVDTTKAKLAEAGFEVVTAYKVDKKGEYTSIVFTNDALKAAADKSNRGFAAVLRVLVNNEKQELSFTNPVYFGKAFLQDDFDFAAAEKLQETLTATFGELKNSADAWEYEGLSGYHFMMGMPYYEENAVLAEGADTELLEKAKSYKKGKNLVFELKIGESRTLLGYALGRKTSKFVKKIGYQNAQVLPYTILIEEGKAKILAPKYYIAVSYPQLTMGEFMTIASVPGAIEKDLAKPFK